MYYVCIVMRNSDSAQNYVDRVRLPDSSYIFGGPGRGSGWRQRSLSNIDLTSQTRHSFTKQSRDSSSGLYDLYSRIESRKDYQNFQKYINRPIDNKQSESIYDHVVPDIQLGPDACSLRRTRSLAVIREETYNDLQITGIRTRRSQLIPRAKLVDRSFFKNRKFKFREEDSGSGVDTQTSETRESDDYYAHLKKLDSFNSTVEPWINDKSDLDSLESDYFKNSLHQSPVQYSREKSPKIHLKEVQVHDSKTNETPATESKVESIDKSEDSFEEVTLTSNHEDSDSTYASCKLTYNTNTLTLTRVKITDFDNEKKSKFKEDGKSVISYDSIYLSSEGSNEQTIVEEVIEDPLPDVRVNETGEFCDDHNINSSLDDQDQPSLDSLYSQINKTKPKIVSLEPKSHLTSFSDTSTRGTLERLTFISTTPQTQKKEFSQVEGKRFSTEPFVGTLIDNQYCSLPDVNIGLSLRASEQIDEKLRLSCKIKPSNVDTNNNSIYDSISRFGKAHKRLRQRESLEADEILSPPEETHKENESVEVKLPSKHIDVQQSLWLTGTKELSPPADNNSQLKPTDVQQSLTTTETKQLSKPTEVKQLLKPTQVRQPVKPTEVKQALTPIEVKKPLKPFEVKQPLKSIEVKQQLKSIESIEKSVTENSREVQPVVISLGKKKIIVDELAAKAQKTFKEGLVNETIKLDSNKIKQFADIKIIVTDAHNNIVDESQTLLQSVNNQTIKTDVPKTEIKPTTRKEICHEVFQTKNKNQRVEALKNRTPDTEFCGNNSTPSVTLENVTLKLTNNETKENIPHTNPLESQKSQIQHFLLKKTKSVDHKDFRSEFKANLTDTLRKRIAESRNIFNARPIRISSEENIEKLNETYEIHSSLAYKVKFKEHKKMSRPQILTVVDSKRNVCTVAPRQATEIREDQCKSNQNPIQETQVEVQQEFQEKVDSVRCYWSKLIEENCNNNVDEVDHETSSEHHQQRNENIRNYIASVEKQNLENAYKNGDPNVDLCNNEDFTSFSPNVDIIECNSEKHIPVRKNQSFETQDFDHVRYKVMKSDTFQKNILAHNRKEAQFDGLLQYLHNYSFQELLASNNVVIIEPIRTKIEKPTTKNHESQTVNCKITGGAGKLNEINKNGLKRHFFYHPIRVNKELLDEELPNPDTVRNARKLFEETLRLRSGQKRDDATGIRGNGNLRKKALRYLTIDTSFGDGAKKWDSSSVSSGISSGELSSPCECNDHDESKEAFSSEENICADELCESYYVSQDVLEKIRECGSSITYYGGRVVDNKSPEVSPMTKAIMQEIRGQMKMCGVCQPNNCPHQAKIFPKRYESDNLGLKFKLVKSNSCSSRLELTGTGIDEQQLRDTKHHISAIENRSAPEPFQDAEESVRTLVNRLETGAINQKGVPRIIESKCIEKTIDTKKIIETDEAIDTSVSINNQMIDEHQSRLGPVDILRQVTVNNHINFTPPVVIGDNTKTTTPTNTSRSQQHQHNNLAETLRTNKVPRNRNVDLAFAMNKTAKESKEKSEEMKNLITNEMVLEPDENQQANKTSFRNAKNLLNETNENNETQMTIQVCSTKREMGVGVCKANGGHEQQQSTQSPRQPAKWNTLSCFDEKNYVANDMKLKQKPKYDEIEFEEFEVYDPNNANNECYDSLNDK